mgnify:FL=1
MSPLISSIAVVALLVFALLTMFAAVVQRRLMLRSLGRAQYRSSLFITCLNDYKSSVIWFQFVAGGGSLIWAVYEWIQHFTQAVHPVAEFGTLLLPTLALVFGLVVYANQLRPAGVILLGNSSSHRLRLQQRLLVEAAPFRTVSLLHRSPWGNNALASGHSFRTSIRSWERAVSNFAKAVGIVVLDLRGGTGWVEIETDTLRRLNLGYKLLVLPPMGGLDLSEVPAQAKIVYSEDDVVRIVKKCLLEPGFRATQECPISSWA